MLRNPCFQLLISSSYLNCFASAFEFTSLKIGQSILSKGRERGFCMEHSTQLCSMKQHKVVDDSSTGQHLLDNPDCAAEYDEAMYLQFYQDHFMFDRGTV